LALDAKVPQSHKVTLFSSYPVSAQEIPFSTLLLMLKGKAAIDTFQMPFFS